MQNEFVTVSVNPAAAYIARLKMLEDQIRARDEEIAQLKSDTAIEQTETPQPRKNKKRYVSPENNTYSDFKSNGVRKPHPADSIRSYDDFKAIQDYFLSRGNIRDWTMWTIGVSLGLRISDVLALRFGHFVEDDKRTFRPRLAIYEQKTGKLQDVLITEAVQSALTKYFVSLKYRFSTDSFLFPSRKTKGKMFEEYGWKILSDAGKACGLPINIGSHTMRKSFANIAACVDKSTIDMNSITKVQGLLNHSDQKSTLRYLGTYQDMYDRARIAVSDFVLGKTGVNEIIAGNQYTIDDVIEKVQMLENLLQEREQK